MAYCSLQQLKQHFFACAVLPRYERIVALLVSDAGIWASTVATAATAFSVVQSCVEAIMDQWRLQHALQYNLVISKPSVQGLGCL